MNHMSYYNRVVGRRCHGTRGFRLNSRRFSVQRLRVKFYYLFKILSRFKSAYNHAVNIMKKNIGTAKKNTSGRKEFLGDRAATEYRLKSYGRSNSFYSEAIADCLEFIKRSSVSADEEEEEEEERILR